MGGEWTLGLRGVVGGSVVRWEEGDVFFGIAEEVSG